jgi:hypothetical protein
MASRKGIFVVAGIGNGTGTGASSARVFANAGYKVALIARDVDHLNKLAEGIKTSGPDVSDPANVTVPRLYRLSMFDVYRRLVFLSKIIRMRTFMEPLTPLRSIGRMKRYALRFGTAEWVRI